MANPENDPSKVTALYPDPPPFWKDFIPENLARFDSLKEEFAEQHGLDVDTIIRVPDIPDDLIYLQPPAEPAEGKWQLFDDPQSIDDELQSLEAAGIQRLAAASETDRDGKHMDRAFELKRLAKSLLLNFLELLGIMSYNPAHGLEKVEDLKTLFLNFHHFLNEYRPHQAREQLIQLMQDQLDSKRAETAAIRAVVDKAKRALEGLGSMDIPALEEPVGGTEDDKVAAGGVQAPVDEGRREGGEEEGGYYYWAREGDGWGVLDGEFA